MKGREMQMSESNHENHGLGENFFAVLTIFLAALFLFALAWVLPEIRGAIGETFGQPLPRLILYTLYWAPVIYFLGGRRFKVIPWLKANPVAFAIIAASIILGASNVIHR